MKFTEVAEVLREVVIECTLQITQISADAISLDGRYTLTLTSRDLFQQKSETSTIKATAYTIFKSGKVAKSK